MCRLQKAYRLSLNSYLHIQGPNITAFQTRRLSAQGAPEMPPGGSEESLLKSRINRRFDGVDWISTVLRTMIDRFLVGTPVRVAGQTQTISRSDDSGDNRKVSRPGLRCGAAHVVKTFVSDVGNDTFRHFQYNQRASLLAQPFCIYTSYIAIYFFPSIQ